MRRWAPLALALAFVRCGDDRSCRYDADCADDEVCEGAVEGTGCGGDRTGECKRLAPSCADEGEGCEAGLICHHAYEPPECRAPSPLGGPCAWDWDCEGHDWPAPDSPLCQGADRAAGAIGRCIEPGAVPTGGSCRDWRACAAPDGCVDGVCRGPGVDGEACGGGGDDRPPCVDGLYCSRYGVCSHYRTEGERCFSDDDRCAAGLFCYSQEAVCHAPLGEGEICIAGDLCATGLFCSSRSTCRPPLAEGERCWDGDRCADGLFCYSREASCHAPLGEGEPCEPGHDVCAAPLACDRTAEVCTLP